MLRVGLTGDLGSGKSTAARMLAEHGAIIFSSDEMGRSLMQPGQAVYAEIVAAFGSDVVASDGTLDRRSWRRWRLIRKVAHRRAKRDRASGGDCSADEPAGRTGENEPGCDRCGRVRVDFLYALLDAGKLAGTFDCVLVVDTPEAVKIARYVYRLAAGRTLSVEEQAAFEADARQRLHVQHATSYPGDCLMLHNDCDVDFLEQQVAVVWKQLQQMKPLAGKH